MMKAVILSLFAFNVQITTGNVTLVQKCPETKAAWDYRSSLFTCEDGQMKYHCVMTNMEDLVEVCIPPLNTTGNEEGCPSVYIFESSAYWMFPFTPCPVQNTECPQEDQRGYSSEELFKFPSCFLNTSVRISGRNESGQTTTVVWVTTSHGVREEFYRSDVSYTPYPLIALFLLIALLFIFIFLQNRTIRSRIKDVKDIMQERKGCTSGNSTSSGNNLIDLKDPYMEIQTIVDVPDTSHKCPTSEDADRADTKLALPLENLEKKESIAEN